LTATFAGKVIGGKAKRGGTETALVTAEQIALNFFCMDWFGFYMLCFYFYNTSENGNLIVDFILVSFFGKMIIRWDKERDIKKISVWVFGNLVE
jgi:hypothetical protein